MRKVVIETRPFEEQKLPRRRAVGLLGLSALLLYFPQAAQTVPQNYQLRKWNRCIIKPWQKLPD